MFMKPKPQLLTGTRNNTGNGDVFLKCSFSISTTLLIQKNKHELKTVMTFGMENVKSEHLNFVS